MAEIATNVLHNVGNVLISVYTSAQLARTCLVRIRLEQVEQVAEPLHAHQEDLSSFLSHDKRGHLLIPFMDKLGRT
jgi:hypothetical protein